MPITYEPLLSQDAKDVLEQRGWNKGLVVFGAVMSESTVKIHTAIKLLTSHADDFGFPYKSFTVVNMDFNDKDTATADGKGSLGVWSPAWRAISDSGPMPGIAMDGKVLLDTKMIVAGLSNKYKDKTLSASDQREVEFFVELNKQYQDKLMDAAIHWGWAGFHGRVKDMPADRYEKAMAPYEKGKKDLVWQRQTVKEVDDFFNKIESKLTGKPVTGYLVAGKTTLADCAIINWMLTMNGITNLEMANRYPNTTKYYTQAKAQKTPAGADDHYSQFAMFGKIVHMVNACGGDRACCCSSGGHDINNPAYWP